ncbi:MAG: hypothetical protein A2Y10_18280 [Planctomycetes bacterium GWF2_41_51]|nr:MAG: hypothetical protein A2Y10_18280 [Planctomycetes bacterium GWF2_41_51]HBG27943.1 phosphoribosyltransferase [Phycisphaerales bacterium]
MGKLQIISESSEPFQNRIEAGKLLLNYLEKFKTDKTVVLGIPRGGVIIANEIAVGLKAAMDIVLTHKIGAPGNKELAVGAISENGSLFVNESIADYVGADQPYIEREKKYQLQEIESKVQLYREILPKLELKEKIVIITDDGVATGATMQAALWAIRQKKPEKLILALPVGPEDAITKLSKDADDTICLKTPQYFEALNRFYIEFNQVEDEHLLRIFEQENKRRKNK